MDAINYAARMGQRFYNWTYSVIWGGRSAVSVKIAGADKFKMRRNNHYRHQRHLPYGSTTSREKTTIIRHRNIHRIKECDEFNIPVVIKQQFKECVLSGDYPDALEWYFEMEISRVKNNISSDSIFSSWFIHDNGCSFKNFLKFIMRVNISRREYSVFLLQLMLECVNPEVLRDMLPHLIGKLSAEDQSRLLYRYIDQLGVNGSPMNAYTVFSSFHALGVDLDATDDKGQTPLQKMYSNDVPGISRLLFTGGVNVNQLGVENSMSFSSKFDHQFIFIFEKDDAVAMSCLAVHNRYFPHSSLFVASTKKDQPVIAFNKSPVPTENSLLVLSFHGPEGNEYENISETLLCDSICHALESLFPSGAFPAFTRLQVCKSAKKSCEERKSYAHYFSECWDNKRKQKGMKLPTKVKAYSGLVRTSMQSGRCASVDDFNMTYQGKLLINGYKEYCPVDNLKVVYTSDARGDIVEYKGYEAKKRWP